MKGVKHYLKDGTLFTGKTHKHPDGSLMTGAKMSKSSKKLVHLKDLSKTAKAKSKTAKAKSNVKTIKKPNKPK